MVRGKVTWKDGTGPAIFYFYTTERGAQKAASRIVGNFISDHLCAIGTGVQLSAPTAAPEESLRDDDLLAATPLSPAPPARTAEVAVQCSLLTTPSPIKRRTTDGPVEAVTERAVTEAAVKRPRLDHQLPQIRSGNSKSRVRFTLPTPLVGCRVVRYHSEVDEQGRLPTRMVAESVAAATAGRQPHPSSSYASRSTPAAAEEQQHQQHEQSSDDDGSHESGEEVGSEEEGTRAEDAEEQEQQECEAEDESEEQGQEECEVEEQQECEVEEECEQQEECEVEEESEEQEVDEYDFMCTQRRR